MMSRNLRPRAWLFCESPSSFLRMKVSGPMLVFSRPWFVSRRLAISPILWVLRSSMVSRQSSVLWTSLVPWPRLNCGSRAFSWSRLLPVSWVVSQIPFSPVSPLLVRLFLGTLPSRLLPLSCKMRSLSFLKDFYGIFAIWPAKAFLLGNYQDRVVIYFVAWPAGTCEALILVRWGISTLQILLQVFETTKVSVESSVTFLGAGGGSGAWATWFQVSHLMSIPVMGVYWLYHEKERRQGLFGLSTVSSSITQKLETQKKKKGKGRKWIQTQPTTPPPPSLIYKQLHYFSYPPSIWLFFLGMKGNSVIAISV